MYPLPFPLKFCKGGKHKSLLRYSDFCVFVLGMDEIVKKCDLGHDDIDGQECKDGRSRTWMILLYEDDPTHKLVLDETLADLDWNYAGRIHDQDEGVKPHHHIVVLFKDGRKKADIAKDLGIEMRWLRAWDKQKKALRYLCHKDNPEKFQYHPDGIYGTIAEKAIAQCSKNDQLSESQSVKEIIDLLDSIDGIVSYSFFLALLNERGLFSVFRRMGVIATRLLDEHNAKVRSAIDRELKADQNRESFRAFLKHIDELPFEERCAILEQKGFPPLALDDK